MKFLLEKPKSKKGEISGELILFIPRVIFLIAVLFAVVILMKTFLVTTIDVRKVESDVLVNRILYSKNGLSYYDKEIGRVYHGIIDLSKFNQFKENRVLDTASINYGKDNPIIAAKIILKQKGKNDLELFYNKDRYDKWEPRALSTVTGGAGSVKSFIVKKNVLIKDDEKLYQGLIEFQILG